MMKFKLLHIKKLLTMHFILIYKHFLHYSENHYIGEYF